MLASALLWALLAIIVVFAMLLVLAISIGAFLLSLWNLYGILPGSFLFERFVNRLYYHFVEIFPDRRTIGEISLEFLKDRHLLFEAMQFLILEDYVEVHTRSTEFDDYTGESMQDLFDSFHLARLSGVTSPYTIFEYSWSGQSMRRPKKPRRGKLTLVQIRRIARSLSTQL